MLHKITSCAFAVLFLIGCDSSPPKEIDSFKSELAELKERIIDIQAEKLVSDYTSNLDRTAHLEPGKSGYSIVRYDLGVLLVSIEDIQPYANGSKVLLRFGNPLASSINGLKSKVEWGTSDQWNGMAVSKSTKSKDITFNEVIRTGSWTDSSVVLEGVPPESLSFVRISNISHTGISLSMRQR
jgi:hypothetical protein